jgi:hypothetical protein
MDQEESKNTPLNSDELKKDIQSGIPVAPPVEPAVELVAPVESAAVSAAPAKPAKPAKPTPRPGPAHVLPAKRYRLKAFVMFIDILAIAGFIYFLMARSIFRDIQAKTFSFASNQMFSFYCIIVITLIFLGVLAIFKFTKSAQTRFARSNEVRQNPNIKVWLTGFDWGWPVLFLPTMTLMFAAGVIGTVLSKVVATSPDSPSVIPDVIGGIVLVVATLNAAVVIFKLKPVVLGLLAGSFLVMLLILLLHGPDTFLAFFKGFKVLGVNIEPRGYILLAYIWSIFLRIIWLKSLFFYWVFLPNRLEMQHGLSESNDSIDRDDLRHKIDTDDVILRWWNVGIITFYFPELDRLPITNVVWGIRKKAVFANRIASVKTMSD